MLANLRRQANAEACSHERGWAMSANPLVGTWRLVSFQARDGDGRVTHPFGPDAVGFLTYTADGRMAVQFGRADRPSLAVGDWSAAPAAEVTAAAREFFAYCGTYEVHEDSVVHRVELSLMPNWVGAEQARLVALDGDTVTLTTPPTLLFGRLQIGTLLWQRVRNEEDDPQRLT
jgi:hypothetical protein